MAECCPECGAPVPHNETCQSNFHALLYHENAILQVIMTEQPDAFASEMGRTAHFYTVSCYALQHPASMGYTVAALLASRDNLADHLAGKATLEAIMQRTRRAKQRIQRREGDPIHDWQVREWPYTVAGVLATPITLQDYYVATTDWARATLDAIAAVGSATASQVSPRR